MKILITTGGSGGHIYPALRVAEVLRQQGHDIAFAGVLSMAEDQIMSAGFDVYPIKAKGLDHRSVLAVFSFIGLMLKAIVRSIKILKQVSPDKVVGFGGYGSFPVITAAWLLRKPILIHEQNVHPGKANRLMGKMAQKIAISFKDSCSYFSKSKVVLTGCPCLAKPSPLNPQESRRKFDLDDHKLTILLLGGSQGSQAMNHIFFQWVKKHYDVLNLQVIHMTGKADYDNYQMAYAQAQIPSRVCAFISNIDEAYRAADIVVARAGASTVTEIALLNKKAILIPYPFAGGHQKYNAMAIMHPSWVHVIDQKQLSIDTLDTAFRDLCARHLEPVKDLAELKGIVADSPRRVAQEVVAL